MSNVKKDPPKPADIKAAREECGVDETQEKAGERISVARRTWQDYERGERDMPPGLFELYLIKTRHLRKKQKK
jgi:putative transcriptional regulator